MPPKKAAARAKAGKPMRTMDPEVTAEVQYDQQNPIPLELENIFGFSPGGNKFIPFFDGVDTTYGFNAFFINILRARQESATQNACIVAKTRYTIGGGVFIDGAYDREGRSDDRWQAFLKRANVDGKSLNTVLHEVIDHLYTFGNACVEIVRGIIGGRRFLYVYCKNILDCRKSWPDENNVSNAVVISRWFRKPGVYNLTQRFNIRIPQYRSGPGMKDRFWLQDGMAAPDPDREGGVTVGEAPAPGIPVWRTCIWLRDAYPGYDHYGLPSWLPAMIYGKLENESANYNLDMLNNNMNPGGMMIVDSSLGDDDLREFSRRLNRQYIQKGRKGRILVVTSEEAKGTYTPFPTQKEGSYIDLSNLAREEIISANEWDGALLGKVEKGTMGKGGGYLKELYQQKVKTVIRPRHQQLREELLTPLCEIADAWLGTRWSRYNLDIAVADIFDDTTDASTTVPGLQAFMDIVKLVGAGTWSAEAAAKFAAEKYGVDVKTAREWLGNILVTPPQGGNA